MYWKSSMTRRYFASRSSHILRRPFLLPPTGRHAFPGVTDQSTPEHPAPPGSRVLWWVHVWGLQREDEVASTAAVQAVQTLSYGSCGAAYITANDVGVATLPGSFVRPSHLTTHEPLIKLFVKLLDQVWTRRLSLFSLILYLCSYALD